MRSDTFKGTSGTEAFKSTWKSESLMGTRKSESLMGTRKSESLMGTSEFESLKGTSKSESLKGTRKSESLMGTSEFELFKPRQSADLKITSRPDKPTAKDLKKHAKEASDACAVNPREDELLVYGKAHPDRIAYIWELSLIATVKHIFARSE